MKKFEVEYRYVMDGSLIVEAESAEEAKQQIDEMGLDELEEGHFQSLTEIDHVEELDQP